MRRSEILSRSKVVYLASYLIKPVSFKFDPLSCARTTAWDVVRERIEENCKSFGTTFSGRRIQFNLGLTCGWVQIIIAADKIKTAHDFTSSHNRHHRYLLIHSHEMLLQHRDIRKKLVVAHCHGVGAWQRNP